MTLNSNHVAFCLLNIFMRVPFTSLTEERKWGSEGLQGQEGKGERVVYWFN